MSDPIYGPGHAVFNGYIVAVDEASDLITVTVGERDYLQYPLKPWMERYGSEVLIEGRLFLTMGNGRLAWCMDRWTAEEIASIKVRADELSRFLMEDEPS